MLATTAVKHINNIYGKVILNKLEELRPILEGNKPEKKDENIDPRWDKLKNLLTDK